MIATSALIMYGAGWLINEIYKKQQDGIKVKAFRIKYKKTIDGIAEIEASSAADAWKRITSGDLIAEGEDRNVVWMMEGELKYTAETTEEVIMEIASNPS